MAIGHNFEALRTRNAMEIMDLCSEVESVGEEMTVEERRERVVECLGRLGRGRRGRR